MREPPFHCIPCKNVAETRIVPAEGGSDREKAFRHSVAWLPLELCSLQTGKPKSIRLASAILAIGEEISVLGR